MGRALVKMQITTELEMLVSPSGAKQFLTALNWTCPKCGYEIPVTINDARRESRYQPHNAMNDLRRQYKKED